MHLTEFKAAGNILTLEVREAMSQTRFQAVCRDMDRAAAALGTLRLVLVMRHYPSLNSAEDFYDDLRFLRLYTDAVEKVAVVCDRFWKDTWVGIFGLFSGIRMACFGMSDVDAVTRWIKEN